MFAWIEANKLLARVIGIAVLVGAVALSLIWLVHSAKASQEAVDAAKSDQALADMRVQQKAHNEAENVRVKEVITDYETRISTPNPAVVGLAKRLHYYALSGCAVPTTSADPSGAESSTEDASGTEQAERDIEGLADAASDDAEQVIALQHAWPK